MNNCRLTTLLLLACASIAQSAQTAQTTQAMTKTLESVRQQVKKPVKLDRTGFEFGVFDVGALLVSGQPSEEALRALAKEGYTMVINLRPSDEMMRVAVPELALLQELGIEYVRIPLGGEAHPYTPEAVDKFAEAVAKNHGRGKTLLHCTVAYRASYLWTAFLVRHLKMDLNDAVRHGEAMNMRNLLEPLLGQKIKYDGTGG